MRILLIDDIRNLKADVIARNHDEGLNQLTFNGPWDILLLDHDLASFDEDGIEKTGYDIMCFLEEHPQFVPEDIVCVSGNPVGKKRIEIVVKKIMETKNEDIYSADSTSKKLGIEYRDDGTWKSFIVHLWFWKLWVYCYEY